MACPTKFLVGVGLAQACPNKFYALSKSVKLQLFQSFDTTDNTQPFSM